ncbi:MAG: hypothetical protein II086_08530 [Ruminococcus sp.]|nr:hypothetical protein [Ruminococcus sp.]MBQ1617288.1 hypothetical protein [Ruminococcus sp.]
MEENRSTITYDENWQDVTEPEYPVILEPSENDDGEDEELPKRMPRKRTAPKQLLLTMQLIACILLILAAFAIKGIGGELYQTAREWYYTHLNRSAIFEENRNFDFSALLRLATPDEAENPSDGD